MPALPVLQWFSTFGLSNRDKRFGSRTCQMLWRTVEAISSTRCENNLQLHCTGTHCIAEVGQAKATATSKARARARVRAKDRVWAGPEPEPETEPELEAEPPPPSAGLMWSNNVLCKFQGSALVGSTNRIDGAGDSDADADADSNWIELKLIESNQIGSDRIDRLGTNRI